MRRRIASSTHVTAVLWPRPAKSSSSTNSPDPKRRLSPSVTAISHSPERVIANLGRGEGCQDPSQLSAYLRAEAAGPLLQSLSFGILFVWPRCRAVSSGSPLAPPPSDSCKRSGLADASTSSWVCSSPARPRCSFGNRSAIARSISCSARQWFHERCCRGRERRQRRGPGKEPAR